MVALLVFKQKLNVLIGVKIDSIKDFTFSKVLTWPYQKMKTICQSTSSQQREGKIQDISQFS